MQSPSVPARLRRSRHLSWFAHMGAVYLFHDLYGYLMEMSPDIAGMIEAFDDGVDTEETIAYYQGKFGDADPRQFVEVLNAHAVLIDPNEDEIEALWAFVPIKGKWNVWQRRDDRLTLWTAWGDKPVQQIFLDPEETTIWDALTGDKRLIEMRHHYNNDKLLGLVRRLVHSDVQALKLSMMPWSMYAKRPSLAPAYLASTMPYARWQPGTQVPPAASLTAYHVESIGNPDEQFDHQETTLSHLLRVPHPALAGRTYGQALVDALLAKGAIGEGRVRVLEIGAGLGYVARHVIDRLREKGRTVEYTIVELSPALAGAQRERLGGDATWIEGDALAVDVPAGAFDLVISNEMVGDLPAKQLSRVDIGLDLAGTGSADRDKVRAVHPLADAVNLDDAPEPFYLQTGAFELVARIAKWLAPGGTAVVTEFGDANKWPRLSTQLDHPELSTHFGHLQQIARAESLEASVEFVIDLLEVDRAQEGLATTRSQFRALRALAANADLDLPKIGYTRELLAHTVAGKLDLTQVGDLRFDRIEDRLMGLVPHEFKALLAKKPS
ncbi:MAG TPA: class I SAM-dependent methyltransferase [Kofleriaceae bacterium]|nr:class I SAM-dependent methyltransferase [Kofleriaceae bacterium]